MRRTLALCTLIGLGALTACGGDDAPVATTAVSTTSTASPSTTGDNTTADTTTAPTTTAVAATTRNGPDPALAPPCNVGEVKVNRESKQFYEPGDPRYGTVPPSLVICLPNASVAQSEGFTPAPPA